MGYFQRLWNGHGGAGIGAGGQPPDTLWIKIQVYEMDKQNLNARDIHHITRKGQVIDTFFLLAPNEIFENINHSWEEFDTHQGRLSSMITNYRKEYDQYKQAGKSAIKAAKEKGGSGQQAVENFLEGGSTEAGKNKMDSPLVFSGSARREYNLTFYLHDQDKPGEIMDVADAFRRYGCARIGAKREALARIDFPYIFELSMYPGEFIYIKNCALSAVQTTYGMPYMKGYPTQITMSLTFLDLQPLYEASFDFLPDVIVDDG